LSALAFSFPDGKVAAYPIPTMKTSLSLSLIGNGALLGALLFMAHRQRGNEPIVPIATKEVAAGADTVAEPVPSPAHQESGGGAFRRDRIKSTDYRTYLANLREIGCPEQTIRDIITADVHRLYARRREELRVNGPAAASSVLEAKLRDLENSEKALIATLLGPEPSNQPPVARTSPMPASFEAQTAPSVQAGSGLESPNPTLLDETSFVAAPVEAELAPAIRRQLGLVPSTLPLVGQVADSPVPVDAGSASAAQGRRAAVAAPSSPVSIPTAWREPDPATLSLTKPEVGAVGEVRQLFREQMAEVNLGPSDPGYLERWRNAQFIADERLAAQLGQPRYDELESLGTLPPVSDSP
jgi:hypothetical protein